MRKSYTFDNNLKVKLRQIARKWHTGILHTSLAVFLMVTVACDFDMPEKFEMPVWYLDLKIPLVSSKYEMTDISNPDVGIFEPITTPKTKIQNEKYSAYPSNTKFEPIAFPSQINPFTKNLAA